MLDEQLTLTILGWIVGSVSIGVFLVSALALHRGGEAHHVSPMRARRGNPGFRSSLLRQSSEPGPRGIALREG